MTLLLVLLAALGSAARPAAAGDTPSLIVASQSGLMHLDGAGRLLGWRPETMQWWQSWHVAANPRNDTVCWVNADQDQTLDALVRCAPVDNLNATWDLSRPQWMRVNSVNAIEFDWVSNNWLLTVSRVNYVCSYLFDKCIGVGKSGGHVRYFAAYDIPNRLLFRVSTDGPDSKYRLESVRLDGSGRRILPAELLYPAGLAVDPADRRVYWLDELGGFDTDLISVDYDGNGRELVFQFDDQFQAWRRSLDIVGDSIYVMWNDQKFVSLISKKSKQRTDLVRGQVEGVSVPALRDVHGLLAVKAFSPDKQPDSENLCGTDGGGCQDLCVPTVINGSAASSCFCSAGFQLVQLSCHEQYPAFAVVVGADSLMAMNLPTEELYTIHSGLSNATKLDFFWEGEQRFVLFWLDAGSLFRGRWSPDGPVSDVQLLIRATQDVQVLDVAVDWSQRNLIWIEKNVTKSSYDRPVTVKVSRLNGTFIKTISKEYGGNPSGLTVIRSGLLYVFSELRYGDYQFATRYMEGGKSYLGFGDTASKFLTTQPHAMAVDVSLENRPDVDRYFWINSGNSSIELLRRGFLSGYELAQLITHPSLTTGGGLDVLGPWLLWTDRSTGQLWTADSETGEGVRDLTVNAGAGAAAVRLLHPWKQPPPDGDLCHPQRSGCSHLCLRVLVDALTLAAQCACPDGMKLGNDGETCQPVTSDPTE